MVNELKIFALVYIVSAIIMKLLIIYIDKKGIIRKIQEEEGYDVKRLLDIGVLLPLFNTWGIFLLLFGIGMNRK